MYSVSTGTRSKGCFVSGCRSLLRSAPLELPGAVLETLTIVTAVCRQVDDKIANSHRGGAYFSSLAETMCTYHSYLFLSQLRRPLYPIACCFVPFIKANLRLAR